MKKNVGTVKRAKSGVTIKKRVGGPLFCSFSFKTTPLFLLLSFSISLCIDLSHLP